MKSICSDRGFDRYHSGFCIFSPRLPVTSLRFSPRTIRLAGSGGPRSSKHEAIVSVRYTLIPYPSRTRPFVLTYDVSGIPICWILTGMEAYHFRFWIAYPADIEWPARQGTPGSEARPALALSDSLSFTSNSVPSWWIGYEPDVMAPRLDHGVSCLLSPMYFMVMWDRRTLIM